MTVIVPRCLSHFAFRYRTIVTAFFRRSRCTRCVALSGVLVSVLAPSAVAAISLNVERADLPVLRAKTVNPVLGFRLSSDTPTRDALGQVEVTFPGAPAQALVAKVYLCVGSFSALEIIASATPSSGLVRLAPSQAIEATGRSFWVAVSLADDASLDARIALELATVKVGGEVIKPEAGVAHAMQRIGVALRQRGDDGSDSYRIPGLARTLAGSLIAVYDVRRSHCRDLPARIDVGVSRSTDGGQTWSPMGIAMRPASLGEKYASGGIGDPAILVDRATGRIWVAALWGHGDIGWESSKAGLEPEDTGQLVMTFSDDDGQTWAPLRNITRTIKDPAWRLLLASPGSGVCLQDGTLVFPAIYRAADGGETMGKPFATILWSRDHGENWQVGTGAKIDTTESQVAELADGTLMLNCRDNRGAVRTVMTTRDLGVTWQPHVTDRLALQDPVCMAGLLRWQHPRHGDLLIFSNPASSTAREKLTLKISRDQGVTWPAGLQLLYDARVGSGYSCLAPAGDEHVGVLYEGRCEIYFLRVPLSDLFPKSRILKS